MFCVESVFEVENTKLDHPKTHEENNIVLGTGLGGVWEVVGTCLECLEEVVGIAYIMDPNRYRKAEDK